jgi:hypothetical protein
MPNPDPDPLLLIFLSLCSVAVQNGAAHRAGDVGAPFSRAICRALRGSALPRAQGVRCKFRRLQRRRRLRLHRTDSGECPFIFASFFVGNSFGYSIF